MAKVIDHEKLVFIDAGPLPEYSRRFSSFFNNDSTASKLKIT